MSSRLAWAAGATLLSVALLPVPDVAAARVQCGAVKSRILSRAVRYCALLPPSYDLEKTRRYPVLYYLHGLAENEQSLVNFGGWTLVEDLREQGRIGEFLIVTPDGGRSFYVNSRDGRERYEDFLLREFLPAIDRTFRTRPARAYRGISGASMGGFGALRLAFRYPELFVSASAHSAALIANPSQKFLSATGPLLASLSRAFGSPPDPAYWQQQSPFALARKNPGLSKLKIYFDCGNEDDYGFDAGARSLDELLNSRRIPHEFHLYPGGHGWLYVAEHLAGSLEFHSRAFGMTRSEPEPRRK